MIQQLIVEGMTCEACEKLIRLRLRRLPEVTDVSASLTSGHVSIESTRAIAIEEIQEALHGTNYLIREF